METQTNVERRAAPHGEMLWRAGLWLAGAVCVLVVLLALRAGGGLGAATSRAVAAFVVLVTIAWLAARTLAVAPRPAQPVVEAAADPTLNEASDGRD